MSSAFEDGQEVQDAGENNYGCGQQKQRVLLGIRGIPQYPSANVIRNGQRIPSGGKASQRRSNPSPGHPGEDDEQNGHGEPRHTVVVAFARMPNEGVGRSECREERDADNGAAQLAVTYVVSTNASRRLVTDIGVVEQNEHIDHEE